MTYTKRILPILIIFILFLAACSNNQDEPDQVNSDNDDAQVSANAEDDEKDDASNKSDEEEPELDIEPLPETYEELAAKPVGEHHDFTFNLNDEDIQRMLDTFNDLPELPEDASNEELDYYYQELLKKVQQEYKGPEEAIKQLRFQSIGNPEQADSRYQFKENLNVEILLDASGSMAAEVNGDVKMDAAKESILQFVESLPEDAKVGIRVYGHEGSSKEADKPLSCSSSEIIYPISSYEESSFQTALDGVTPSGWTPIELALTEAQKDLSEFDGANNTNIVYLVSDGVSTCEDQPVEAAKQLYDSNIEPIVNVIGFDVDNEGQNQLREIADVTEGIYTYAADGNELSDELAKVSDLAETWEKWKEQGEQSLDYKRVNNSLDIFVYITEEKSKTTREKSIINLIVSQMAQNEKISNEARDYLQQKNTEYHDWIREEIDQFNEELKALNEKSYSEALQTLEEKYQTNAQ
ncbi:vWA domain-containing protein [Cytobacillus gottheilii]|uniref:vWA domain-containing protein n=1 Tax=Cytobacillus gottheilii TaxID=859144 RepID=UPI0008324E5D|nr:VWA domain-containing protein [Cytobacillus gottheilii]